MSGTSGLSGQLSGLAAPDRVQRLAHFRWMLLGRIQDDRLTRLKAQGEVAGSVFTGKGQEAFSAAGAMQLKPGDVFAPLIRDAAGRLAFGEPVVEAARAYLGRKTGWMRGRDGNVHRGNVEHGLLPMISHLGAMVSSVNGMLFARRLLGTLADHVGLVSIGDGAMNTGATHEALNQAAVERLPLVVMLADNQLAYSTFSNRTYACRSLLDRAAGYGIRGWDVDGTDADACFATMAAAVAAARAGGGPQVVHGTLLRLAGHGTHDDAFYVTPELKARHGDCLALAEAKLLAESLLTPSSLAAMQEELTALVAQAIEQARSEPQPTAASEEWSAYSSADLAGHGAESGAGAAP